MLSSVDRCSPLIPCRGIVEDVLDLEMVLLKIVELIGAILTDEAERSGRRTAPASINETALRH